MEMVLLFKKIKIKILIKTTKIINKKNQLEIKTLINNQQTKNLQISKKNLLI